MVPLPLFNAVSLRIVRMLLPVFLPVAAVLRAPCALGCGLVLHVVVVIRQFMRLPPSLPFLLTLRRGTVPLIPHRRTRGEPLLQHSHVFLSMLPLNNVDENQHGLEVCSCVRENEKRVKKD